MSKSLHLSNLALLLGALLCVTQTVQAQCTDPNSTAIFLFSPGNDTIFVNDDCLGTVVFGNPFIETTFAGQVIDFAASGVDVGLTTASENATLNGGDQVTVYYVGVEGAPDFRRDTFCYTIDIVDNTPPRFTEFIENDTVCINNIPPPMMIEVVDNCPFSLDSISIMDDTMDTDGFCNGGMIRRTWRAVDLAGNRASMTQLIFVEASPEALLEDYNPEPGVGYCGDGNYVAWTDSIVAQIQQRLENACGVERIAPIGTRDFLDCGSRMFMVNVEDVCGNTINIEVPYSNIDTIGPVFAVPPMDRILSQCSATNIDTSYVEVTDNCDASESIIVAFTQAINPTGNACGETFVTRNWTATDGCGNTTTASNIITIRDTIAPEFDVPADASFDCGGALEDISDPEITGRPTNLIDDCSPNPTIMSFDTVIGQGGFIELHRMWVAEDRCGNQRTKVQRIQFFDTIAPTFDLRFRELDVSCADLDNTDVTGVPEMIFEQCSSEQQLDIRYIDSSSSGSCEGNGFILRTWYVTDAAGNTNELTQELRIQDDANPEFITEASDELINCSDTINIQTAFQAWVDRMGGAIATDNCTSDSSLIWSVFNAGTNFPPSLAVPICGDSLGIYRTQAVDFIVEDLCGNMATSTASFSIIDNTPPVFGYCPPDTTLRSVNGSCSANFMLVPPRVVEICGAEQGIFSNRITAAISSDEPGNKDVPVNDVQLSFSYIPSRDFPLGNVSLTLELFNVDADHPSEYFLVYLEDGTPIGRTSSTPRCGSSLSPDVFLNLTADQMIQAAGSNSRITFFLRPNVPTNQAPEFAISDICGNSSVRATLSFDIATPTGMTYWYSVNEGSRILYDPHAPISEELNAGMNIITYEAMDCAGNLAACSYTVNVTDDQAPGITCPSDIVMEHDSMACTASYTLPLPEIVTDNCIFGNSSSITVPSDSSAALLTFTASPDLGDFLANDVILNFDDINRSTLNDVSLVISIRGNVDNDLAYFIIEGEDGSLLSTTRLGQSNVTSGDCNNFSETFISIAASDYNVWAADGQLTITARANTNIPIPPGGPGDGFNACDDGLVNVTGDNDGTSMLFGTLNFNEVAYSYYTEGATTTSLILVDDSVSQPVVDFNIGITEVFYIIEDSNMNSDTCSFTVTVEDNQDPIASCVETTTISISPAGFSMDTLDVAEINLNSSDNCLIDTMFVSPNIFSCDATSQEFQNITLTVIDGSGNSATCVTPVRVVTESPEPNFFIAPCDGDTLYLYASPPAAPQGVAYTYEWIGPNDFVSNAPNPIIPNPDESNEGSYTVTITGTTGCTASGIVEVDISADMVRPSISAPTSICLGDQIQLNTDFQSLEEISYRWYEVIGDDNVLAGTTTGPSLGLGNNVITEPGIRTYFLEIEIGDCFSNPSNQVSVEVVQVPAADIQINESEFCEGTDIQLSTNAAAPDLIYEWTGPNGFTSNLQNPSAIEDISSLDSGTYYLRLSREGCTSEQDSVVVDVKRSPARPILSHNGPLCEGLELTLMVDDTIGGVYHWLRPNNNSEQINFENSLTIENADLIHDGNWRVYITRGDCNSPISEPVNLEVNNVPNVSISATNDELCEGDNLQLQATPTIDGATYRWVGPNGINASTQDPTFEDVTTNDTGNYSCTVTTEEGCANTAILPISIDEGVVITAVQNTGTDCVSGPTDIRLRGLLSPADDGTYEYTWTGPNGYNSRDSIATIPTATETQNGTYTLVVTNSGGCQSEEGTTMLNIREAPQTPATPMFNEGTQPPFCEGDILNIETTPYTGTQVEYHWITPDSAKVIAIPTFVNNELFVSNSGEYAVYVVVDGCQSLQSGVLQVEVGAKPVITIETNSPVCEGEYLGLEATDIPGATYQWSGPSGLTASGNSPSFNSAELGVHDGSYTAIAGLNGCFSDPVVAEVVISPLPDRPRGGASPTTICTDAEDAELRLAIQATSATQGASYTWYDQDLNPLGTLTEGALIFTLTNFTDYIEGTYSFYVQAEKDGCISEFSEAVEVAFSQIPASVAYAGEDINACGDSTIVMDAENPTSGVGMWTQVSGDSTQVRIINPTDYNTVITGLERDNIYEFAWTLSNASCLDYSSDTVIVDISADQAANAGRDTSYCAIRSFFLNAGEPSTEGTGTWTQPEAQELFGVIIENPSDPQTAISISSSIGQDYYFTWTVVGECGTSQDIIRITIAGGIAMAGDDFSDCGDGCTELDAVEPPTGIGEWRAPDTGIFFNDPSDPNTTACGLQDGENMFIWEIDGGACGAASRDTLYVDYKFPAILVDDIVCIILGESIDINVVINDRLPDEILEIDIDVAPLNGVAKHLGDGIFNYRPNSTFTGRDLFTYKVCVSGSECECVTARVFMEIKENADCTVPNIFTPNGDGINDVLVIPCLTNGNFPGNIFTIFNQWGDEVYRKEDYDNSWGGTFDGTPLPPAYYFYIMDFNNGEIPISGYILLQR